MVAVPAHVLQSGKTIRGSASNLLYLASASSSSAS
jgi:hypothetical protein